MAIDVVSAGLSKARILDMNSTFAVAEIEPNRGIPFIYADNLEVMLSVTAKHTDGNLYDYRIMRAFDAESTLAKTTLANKITDPTHKKSLNTSDPTKTVVALSEQNVDIYVQNLDDHLGSGNVIIRRKYKSGGSVALKGVDFKFPPTEKLLGLIPTQAVGYGFYTHEYIAITVETDGNITDGTYYTNAKWRRYLPPSSTRAKEYVGTIAPSCGDVIGTVNINTFGFGRSAVYGTVCAVCEGTEDAQFPFSEHIWTVDGDTPFTVALWDFNDSYELVLTDSLDNIEGVSDGTYYPAKPCIWIIKDSAMIIAGDILYAYKRATVAPDLSYGGTLTRLAPILFDETLNSGGFDTLDGDFGVGNITSFEKGVRSDNKTNNKLIHGIIVKEGILRDWIDKTNLIFSSEVIPKGYGILFREKKTEVDMVIPYADIGTVEGSADPEGSKVKHSRVMDNELPAKVVVNFKDPYRTYNDGTVKAESILTTINSTEHIDCPFFITRAQIDDISKNILKLRWIERDTFEFTLPFTYATLEPGDIIGLELPFDEGSVTVSCRIMKMKHSTNGIITLQVTATGNLLYNIGDASSVTPPDDTTDPYPDPFVQIAQAVFLDIPIVFDQFDNVSGLPVSAIMLIEGTTWGGATTQVYVGGGSSSSKPSYTIDHPNTNTYKVGVATGYLSEHSGLLTDLSTVLEVNFSDPSVTLTTSVNPFTDDGVLFAYGSSEGGWEICKYTTAELVDPDTNTWDISGFLRGLYGTERVTGTHSDGDLVVFLSPTDSLIFQEDAEYISSSDYALGDTFYAQTTIVGQVNPTSESERIACVYNGVNLMPYAGVNAVATRSSGTITLSWMRRDRLENEWDDLADIPMSESTEFYEVDIMDGPDVVRTKTATASVITYSATDQTTDFGSPQSSVTFRIYQKSAIVGRGYVYEVTL